MASNGQILLERLPSIEQMFASCDRITVLAHHRHRKPQGVSTRGSLAGKLRVVMFAYDLDQAARDLVGRMTRSTALAVKGPQCCVKARCPQLVGVVHSDRRANLEDVVENQSPERQ